MMENLSANAFRPWASGSQQKDIFMGDPEGKPFVVRISGPSWLPINILIFAQSEVDAYNRVTEGLRQSLEVSKSRLFSEYEEDYHTARWERLYNLALNGKMEVQEFDKKYASSISWDNRGL